VRCGQTLSSIPWLCLVQIYVPAVLFLQRAMLFLACWFLVYHILLHTFAILPHQLTSACRRLGAYESSMPASIDLKRHDRFALVRSEDAFDGT